MSVITDLHAKGIAMDAAVALIPQPLVEELTTHVATLQAPPPSTLKPYLVQWLGRHPVHDPASIWARIADQLTPIAQAYLHAPAQLYFYNLWQSLVTTAPPRSSQLWHQDTEDRSMLKAFLYLTDVTAEAGPLSYIPETHWRGRRRIRPHARLENFNGMPVLRVSDASMAKRVPQDQWLVGTAPKGTLLLTDTSGWHKGGYATGQERLMGVWQWVTTQCKHPARFAP